MKRYLVLLLLVVSFLLASWHTALAKCAVQSIAQYRKQSDIALEGTATIVVGKDAFVSVDTYFKGHGPETVRITGRMSDAGDTPDDFQVEEGKKYLLFLKIAGSDLLRTTSCMGSRELTGTLSNADREALGKSKITPTPTPKEMLRSTYKLSPAALMAMVFSGSVICMMLGVSVLNDRKKKIKKSSRKKAKKR